MKYIYVFLMLIFFANCSEYSESLKEDFVSSKEITTSDFDTQFPVVNLTVDQKEFDDMYLNYEEDIEIEAFLNLYRNNTLLISEELVEIEVKGASSASLELKSLGVKFDDTFDNEEREVLNPEKTLPNHSLEEIKAFRLRNSGSDFEETMIKDISYTQLAIDAGLNVDLTYNEPSLVFINDVFLGLMNLRSESNTNGMSRLNDTKKSNITLAKINDRGFLEKKDGDFDKIDRFIEAIDNGDIDYLKEEVDIDNLIDYIIFQTYIANIDWPYNNVRFYAVEEGPFRFVVFDLDLVNTKDVNNHPLDFIREPIGARPNASEIIENPLTDLFNVLYADTSFKEQFENRYIELMDNGSLSSEKFDAIVDENFNKINEYMPYQLDKYTGINTMIEWYRNADLLKESFKQREDIIEKMKPLF